MYGLLSPGDAYQSRVIFKAGKYTSSSKMKTLKLKNTEISPFIKLCWNTHGLVNQ